MKKNKIITYGLLFLLGIIYLLLHELFNIGIPCIFKLITNLYCPGCGISRMFISIFHLDFYQAFRFNPFVFILLILYLLYILIELLIKKIKGITLVIPNCIYYILIVLSIIFMILRNLEPFSYLAPTIV